LKVEHLNRLEDPIKQGISI